MLIKHALNLLFKPYCKENSEDYFGKPHQKTICKNIKPILLNANAESSGVTVSHRKLCVYNLAVKCVVSMFSFNKFI